MTDYVSEKRHREIIESCVGQVLTRIEFPGTGEAELTFANGVTIEYSDGWCFSRFEDETGHGSVYEESVKEVRIEPA